MEHVRINKSISNATIIENYQKAIEGIKISFSLYLNVYINEVFDFIVCAKMFC